MLTSLRLDCREPLMSLDTRPCPSAPKMPAEGSSSMSMGDTPPSTPTTAARSVQLEVEARSETSVRSVVHFSLRCERL